MFVALLAAAVAVLAAAEWPRITSAVGVDARRRRSRARRKSKLRVVPSDTDEFAASVRRDLEMLPTTTDERSPRPK